MLKAASYNLSPLILLASLAHFPPASLLSQRDTCADKANDFIMRGTWEEAGTGTQESG